MEEISISLDDLTVRSLEVDSAADGSVEFRLHATIDGVDEDALAALENTQLEPKEVVCAVQPRD